MKSKVQPTMHHNRNTPVQANESRAPEKTATRPPNRSPLTPSQVTVSCRFDSILTQFANWFNVTEFTKFDEFYQVIASGTPVGRPGSAHRKIGWPEEGGDAVPPFTRNMTLRSSFFLGWQRALHA